MEYFLAVAREESITAAADYLHMTQPPLSRQLKELEDELGKKLFVRGNRRITLTEDGMLLRRRAEEILELVRKTKEEVSSSAEDISGDIYIGAAEVESFRTVAKTMVKMRKMYPAVKFHVTSGNAEDIMEKLDGGLYDFALFVDPVQNLNKYNYIRFPQRERWGLLTKSDNPLCEKGYVEPGDLEKEVLMMTSQRMFDSVLAGWYGTDLSGLTFAGHFNLVYNEAIAIEEGLGSALTLDRLITEKNNPNLRFLPLYPEISEGIDFAWKKYRTFSRAAGKFLEMLGEEIKLEREK